MKISIITVALNASHHIEQAINSVLKQDYNNIEFIVIDGDSSDGTCDIVKKHIESVDLFISEKDRGIYDAMNKAIKISTGEYLFFLNSDDEIYDDFVISDIASFIEANKDVDIVYGDVFIEGKNRVRHVPVLDRRTLCNSWVCHQAIFAKRSTLLRTGGFSDDFKIVSDMDWLAKNLTLGVQAKYIDRIISNVSIEGLSGTTNWHHEKRAYFKKNYKLWEFLLWRKLPRLLRLK